MPTDATYDSLLDAVKRYFDLMFTSETSCFDHVFAPSAQLHGLQEGFCASTRPKNTKPRLGLGLRRNLRTLRVRRKSCLSISPRLRRRCLKFVSGSTPSSISTTSRTISLATFGL